MTNHYTRFWCPVETVLRLDGDGFIYDPEAEYGHAANPSLRSLVDWKEAPCLVLLGEPGMGKSTELVAEYERVLATVDPATTDVQTFNLNTYSSDSLLCSDIFESQRAAAFTGEAGLAPFGAGAFLVDLGAVFFVGMVASLSDRGSKERASTNTVGAQEVS